MKLALTPWLGALALVSLSGCSLLPKSDPNTLYRLPAEPIAAANVQIDQRLAVATPEADQLLSSNRIVVFPERSVVNVYQGARWYDDLPDLLQARLIDGLEESALFKSVASDQLPSDLIVLSELRQFQSAYTTTPPTVTAQLDVHLARESTRATLASQRFSVSQQASSVAIEDVVDAFGAASDELTRQLAQWLAREAPTLSAQVSAAR